MDTLKDMNSNIRSFGGNMEERLNRANKAGGYDKKFGFDIGGAKDSDTDFMSAATSGPNKSAFDKMMAKDDKKFNRM